MNRTQRRVAAALATTATISVGGLIGSLDTASGDMLSLPPVTTVPGDPIATVSSLLTTTTAPSHNTTTTTTAAPSATTTTSTTVAPTTTTTIVRPAGNDSGTGSSEWTALPSTTKAAGPLPLAPATGAVAGVLPTADAPVAGLVQPVPVAPSSLSLRSPVLLSTEGDVPFALPSSGRSTKSILNVLFGMELPPATLAKVVAPFPVAGEASYGDDWHAPRFTPEPHQHEGTDVFASRGTPVVASGDGVVTRQDGTAIGGNAIRVTEADGTYYYYAHLDRFASGLQSGQRVSKGDIIGFVGTTGDADGGAPHLHFEIHPKGGPAVPPVPYLDRWLSEALATASTLRAQPGAADSVVTLRPTHGRGKTVNALLRPASSERPVPDGATLDPSSGLEISSVVLFLMWMFRRFRRRIVARREA
jgi:murein DD-endopeptidase MepM/ murein hydrolase activator NlpD